MASIRAVIAGATMLALNACVGSTAGAETINRPFPQHTRYVAGSIKPSHVSQQQMDAKVTAFYEAWKARFLRRGCASNHYYVYLGPQQPISEGTPISVSEGMGYGMMIAAMMAGYDPDARDIFNGMLWYYRAHTSQNEPRLMAWRQVNGCVNSDDPNSAADGDLDIAYGLLLADRQWGSATTAYRFRAKDLLEGMRGAEVHPVSDLVQLGDWVNPQYPDEYDAVRTSDVMPGHFRAFRTATGVADWQSTLDGSYRLLEYLQQTYAATTGLVPEFAVNTDATARPAAPGFKGEPLADTYGYNACRVPWRVAVDYLISGDARAKRIATRLENWMIASTGGDIYKLYAQYNLDGSPVVGYNYVCTTGAFGVGAMVSAQYQTWLNRIWDDVAITYIDTPSDYYGASLRLLYMLAMSGNWWAP